MVAFIDAVRSPNQAAADFLTEQAQRYGLPEDVIAGIVRGTLGLPNTRVRLSHAYTLHTAHGQIIGAVFRTEVGQSRDLEEVMEIDPNAKGEWADIVPQRMTEQSFDIARWDLYDTVMEELFGTSEIVMLTDQKSGFKIREIFRAPARFLNARGRQYEYGPCWFERVGREQAADGDRTIRVNARLKWLRRRKIAGR